MLPDNYYPRAGDIIKIKDSLCVFISSGVGKVALVRFSDKYEKGPPNICLSSGRDIPTTQVYKEYILDCELLGNVDFAKIAKEILNET
jgi:hypothetical protein